MIVVFPVPVVFLVPAVFVVPVAAVLLGFADEPAVVCPAPGVTAIKMARAEASHSAGPPARAAEFVADVREFAAEAGKFATLILPL